LTIFLGFAAINTANNLIYLIVSALLSFMGLSGFFGRRNIQALEVEVESPEETYATRPFVLTVRLINKKRLLPSFLIRVKIVEKETTFAFVDRAGIAVKHLEIALMRRGLHRIEVNYVASVFPFNFFIRFKGLTKSHEIVVFPKPYLCDMGLIREDRQKSQRGEDASNKKGYEADILSMRNYLPGDPFKYINWKATAKTGSLKTKELSSLINEPVIIDLRDIPYDTEQRLSCAAFAINELYKLGIPFGLRIGDRLFAPEHSLSHKIALLRELALYGND
jgi:uncharacterized protein (DUF58 family)